MYKAQIVSIDKQHNQAENSDFLSVFFQILNDSEVVAEKREAFPLDTPSEDIGVAVKKHLDLYVYELEQNAARKEQDELQAKADETIEQLTNKEIE